MTILIWFIINKLVIACTNVGCYPVTISHFEYLIGLGVLETLVEVSGVVRVYKRNNPPEPNKKDMVITKQSKRKRK